MAVKRLDKAAQRGIIHRNQAANRKSALMRRSAELTAAAAPSNERAGAGHQHRLAAGPLSPARPAWHRRHKPPGSNHARRRRGGPNVQVSGSGR